MRQKKKNISGKNVTPFILQYIAEHTKGESLEANIALIKHNAKVGTEISVECIKNNQGGLYYQKK